jgi:hypothetical protein
MKLEEIQSTGKGVKYIHVDPTLYLHVSWTANQTATIFLKLSHGKKKSVHWYIINYTAH